MMSPGWGGPAVLGDAGWEPSGMGGQKGHLTLPTLAWFVGHICLFLFICVCVCGTHPVC